MSDNLRTRIAAAVSGVDDWRGVTDPTILADAVIRELGLPIGLPMTDDTPKQTMRERIMQAILDSLDDDDPPIMLSVGEHTLRVEWKHDD